MSRVETLMITLLAITAGMTMINNLHIYDADIPTMNYTSLNQAKITDLSSTSGLVDQTSDMLGIGFFTKALGFVWDTFKGLLSIQALAEQYHIPSTIYLPFQALIWFSEGWLLVTLWLKFKP